MKFRIILVALSVTLAASAFANGPSGQLTRARTALFVDSDLDAARTAAQVVLAHNPAERGALFIKMEVAALEADNLAELDAAVRLCETRANDARVAVAAARIVELAANTPEFRAVLPRIQALLTAYTPQSRFLRAALLAAAEDGTPGLRLYEAARNAGLVADWRLAGPFGRLSNIDFDRRWPAELDGMSQAAYDGRAVERFRFEDGKVALPDYLDHAGVFYAASHIDVPVPGNWLLRLESAGTVELYLDGTSVLLKDDRFHATPEVVERALWLNGGQHRLFVKFVSSAAPFRLALLPAPQPQAATGEIGFAPEARYLAAAEKYWSGDYDGTIAQLAALRAQKDSAIADYLLAQAWSHVDPDSPEEAVLLSAAVKLAPGALAAEYRLAARAYAEDRADDALACVRRILAARAEYAPAQELMARIAVRLNWRAEAARAFEIGLQLHPSCSLLQEAARLFSADAQFDKAQQTLARLPGCAPGSLAYAQALSEAGRHLRAAQAARAVIAEQPFHRSAHAMLVHELASAGQLDAARAAVRQLIALAPNSERYAKLACAVESGGIADEDTPRASDFGAPGFYAPYRRDAMVVLKDAASRRFSGGPAVTLVYDRVARLAPDGTVALYVHKLTRVLNRDGIERYGEVALPGDADVLELRTIKADGSTAEPELTRHKATVSMPALAPGDTIEQEYVLRFRDGLDDHTQAFQFVFGSFTAPVVYSRFVVLWPAAEAARLQILTSGQVPQPATRSAGDELVTAWEQNDIPQSSEETAMPRADTLPSVRVLRASADWTEIRDRYRDAAIDAARIGSRVEAAAAALAGKTTEQRARELYRIVSRIRPAGTWVASGGALSAEDTLAGNTGNRTAALLALARAAGIRADLLLARDAGVPRPQAMQPDIYTRPLVLLHLADAQAGKPVVVDAETEGMAFGGLSSTTARGDALLVPIDATPAELAQNVIVALPGDFASEQSVADGEVTLDQAGGIDARVNIRMGATRAAQMRSILAGIETSQRAHFFEQLALRIFPGASSASGEVRNEYDIERPLEILLLCRAARFANLTGGIADIDQLVPALGLRKMYGAGARRFPLYIEAPLFETATFRLRLPAFTIVSRRPADLALNTEFGDYSVTFRQIGDDQWEIQRSFRVPVQVVPPDRFSAFSRFSLQIDEAERQRITLQRTPVGSASQNR